MKGMEIKRQSVADWLAGIPAVAGAVLFEDDSKADGERRLLILISEEEQGSSHCLQFPVDAGQLVQIRLSRERLQAAPLHYEDRDLVHWLRKGEILLDPEQQIHELHHRLDSCSGPFQEKLVLAEFCRFYRHYLLSKRELDNQCLLDSFENLLQAIHHWGRLSVVEQGHYPERMIWEQVRTANVGVFKLYEELTSSSESLLKRIQLVLLASEFCVVSKMAGCCSLLLRLLESREEPWGLQELERELGGAEIVDELAVLLSQLEKKALIREVLIPYDEELAVMERKFFRSLDAVRERAMKP